MAEYIEKQAATTIKNRKKGKKTMRHVYVCGRCDGREPEIETMIREAGGEPWFPVDPAGAGKETKAKLGLAMVEGADMVLLLDGWKEDPRAQLEQIYAGQIKRPCVEEKDFNILAAQTPGTRRGKVKGDRRYKKKYSGFLLIQCCICGAVNYNSVKKPITEYTCRQCGMATPLEGLVPAHANCPDCGTYGRYKTNMMEPVTIHCINCQQPVNLVPNEGKTCLKTVGWEPKKEEETGMKPYYMEP